MLKTITTASIAITLTALASVSVRAEESQAFIARNAKIDADYHERSQALANDAVNRQKKLTTSEPGQASENNNS